ncbi:MAG: FMN-binding protein, partial [Butyricicoccus sp.]
EEAICMVARVLGLKSGDITKLERFTDHASIADWARGDIAAMVEAGYVSGNADGTLLPKKQTTRAEGVTVLNQALDQLKTVNSGSTIPTTPTTPGTSSGSSSSGGGASSSSQVYTASSWQTLKSAAFNAKAGDTIRLSADITDAGSDTTVVDGVSSATLTLNKKNITFDGNGKTILAAEGKTFCFDIDGLAGETTGVTVKNLTIDGGSFKSKLGGALFIEDGAQALIQNVTFKNCRAASTSAFNGGGAIFINDHGQIPPSVTVDGCTFENNQVGDEGKTGRGGAIYADNFRASTAMQLTVKNSTFRNNQAAYGGAIAADGVVDLTVTDCTFEGNAATVGADDIYIFEGVSAGKKNMSITSKVTASLSGNVHTNETDSETELTAMNIIFGRYYDAASTEKNPAPDGAADLYFADNERTKLLNPEAAIAMQSMDVNGAAYYYGINQAMADAPVFTVNGEEISAENVDGTNVYYYTAAEQLTGDLYGTATLTYKEFYEGEVGTMDSYDAVSSATMSKNTIFQNEDSTEPVEGEGYKINGVKNVPVRVAADQYIKGTIAGAAGVTSITGYSKAAGVTLNETPSMEVSLYKPLNADGTYGAVVGAKTTVTDATLALSTTSNWGDYQLTVSETSTGYLRNNREDNWAIGSNVLGAAVEAQKDGETIQVGMQHLQNIWIQPYQIAFNISGDDGNVSETAKLQGATTTKITYFVPEGVYEYTFDGTYVKPKYTAELNLSAAFNSDRTAVTLTGVPSELKDVTVSIFYKDGRTNVYAAQDTALVNGSVALSAAVDSSKTYTVLLTSSNYADMSTTISADMTEEQRETLAELIEKGTALVEADSSLTTLKAHVEEAKELLENPDATSAQADELIAELNELIAAANPGSKTVNGEAQVQGFGYTAKVSVSYDTASGKILSVADNGTEPGSNATFWQNATALFAKLTGKTKSEVAGVDGISGATLSSNAIKEAVQSVLPEDEAPSVDLVDWAAYADGFETFLNYMDGSDTVMAAWQKAADKNGKTVAEVQAMWKMACVTTTDGQPTPIANMKFTDNTATFLDADGETIAEYTYQLANTVAAGLEGAETFVFQATDTEAGVFTYLAMMKPDMDGDGTMAAHFHFRYGATKEALDLENTRNMWYPTMCDASATDEQRANVILAMYGIKDDDAASKSEYGEATVKTEGSNYVAGEYQAKVIVTFDSTGKIISIEDNGTEPGANSYYWNEAWKIIDDLKGKTSDEIDAVDAVSGATVSSNAIKEAVKNALNA